MEKNAWLSGNPVACASILNGQMEALLILLSVLPESRVRKIAFHAHSQKFHPEFPTRIECDIGDFNSLLFCLCFEEDFASNDKASLAKKDDTLWQQFPDKSWQTDFLEITSHLNHIIHLGVGGGGSPGVCRVCFENPSCGIVLFGGKNELVMEWEGGLK